MDLTSRKIRQDNVIGMSKDYDRFKRIEGNRPIYPSHVADMVEVMKEKPKLLEYNPILINERFEIIDGQHRVLAAKELELPIFYIQQAGLRLADVQGLNSGAKPWGAMDYARSFAETGRVDYQIYLEVYASYSLSHDLIRYILSHNTITYNMFKKGLFKVVKLLEATDFLDMLTDFKAYYPYHTDRSFVMAFERMDNNADYNHEYMINQLTKHPELIMEVFDSSEYLEQLENIYNTDLPLQDRIRF